MLMNIPRALLTAFLLSSMSTGCAIEDGDEFDDVDGADIGREIQGLSSPAARRTRAEHIRDVAAASGLTNGALLGGIAQVETGLSHCWSEATWACKGPNSPSCGGGPVIAGASDGPCSAKQGGLGLFQFDAGTFSQTLARDGQAVLRLEGNIEHAVDFVGKRVDQEVGGVDTTAEGVQWLNNVRIVAGDPVFERWIRIVACRYNGCCGTCTRTRGKYRDATLAMASEFGAGFWEVNAGGNGGGEPATGDATTCGIATVGSWTN